MNTGPRYCFCMRVYVFDEGVWHPHQSHPSVSWWPKVLFCPLLSLLVSVTGSSHRKRVPVVDEFPPNKLFIPVHKQHSFSMYSFFFLMLELERQVYTTLENSSRLGDLKFWLLILKNQFTEIFFQFVALKQGQKWIWSLIFRYIHIFNISMV